MEIYLVRHTKTVDLPGVCFGQTDVGLASTFETEAGAVKAALPLYPDIIFSSPLKRCVMLAEQLGFMNPKLDNRLMELNFGEWEMKKWEELPQDELLEWTESYVHHAPPGGETFFDMFCRVELFFNEQVFSSKKKTIVIFTHAGVIRSVIAMIHKIKLQDTFNYKVEHGGVFKISGNDGVFSFEGLMPDRN